VRFAPDLSGVGELHFSAEATREHRQKPPAGPQPLRQPFERSPDGSPTARQLAAGFGVMESTTSVVNDYSDFGLRSRCRRSSASRSFEMHRPDQLAQRLDAREMMATARSTSTSPGEAIEQDPHLLGHQRFQRLPVAQRVIDGEPSVSWKRRRGTGRSPR